LCSVVTVFQ